MVHALTVLPHSCNAEIDWKVCGERFLLRAHGEDFVVRLVRLDFRCAVFSIRHPFTVADKEYVFAYPRNNARHQELYRDGLSDHMYSALRGLASALVRAHRGISPRPRIRFYGQLMYVLSIDHEKIVLNHGNGNQSMVYDREGVNACFSGNGISAIAPHFGLFCESIWNGLPLPQVSRLKPVQMELFI